MTNEEFKSKNKEFIDKMIVFESRAVKDVKTIITEASIPRPTISFTSKINELFELFENDDTNLDQHLIIIITAQYLLGKCYNIIQDIDKYVRKVFRGIEKHDDDSLLYLVSIKEDLEKNWVEKDNEILEFDFQNDLEKMLNSGMPLPQGISKERAYEICMSELKKVNYQPKNLNVDNNISGKVM